MQKGLLGGKRQRDQASVSLTHLLCVCLDSQATEVQTWPAAVHCVQPRLPHQHSLSNREVVCLAVVYLQLRRMWQMCWI